MLGAGTAMVYPTLLAAIGDTAASGVVVAVRMYETHRRAPPEGQALVATPSNM